jgi:hypothetical protein
LLAIKAEKIRGAIKGMGVPRLVQAKPKRPTVSRGATEEEKNQMGLSRLEGNDLP